MESLCGDVRLLPARRARVLHHRAQRDPQDVSRLDQHLVQLYHPPDVRGAAAERRDVRAVWQHDEHDV